MVILPKLVRILFTVTVKKLLSQYGDLFGRRDAKFYSVTFHAKDRHYNVPLDDDGLVNLPCEDEHDPLLWVCEIPD